MFFKLLPATFVHLGGFCARMPQPNLNVMRIGYLLQMMCGKIMPSG